MAGSSCGRGKPMMATKGRQGGDGTISKILSNGDPCPHQPKKEKCPKTSGCRWRLQYQDEHGKQREKRFAVWDDAAAWRTKVNNEKRAKGQIPGYLKGHSPLFEEYAPEWLDKRTDLATASIKRYDGFTRRILIPRFRGTRVGKINTGMCAALAKELYDSGRHKGDVQAIIGAVLGGILDLAVKEDFLPTNPAREVDLEEVPKAVVYLPTAEDVRRIADEILPQYRVAVFLGALAGLRAGEMLAASDDCVRTGRIFRIFQQQNPEGQIVPLKGRAEGEFREVPIMDVLPEELERHCQVYGSEGWFFRSSKRPGLPIGRSAFQNAFFRAACKIGLPELHPHCLRHFFATYGVIKTRDIALVAMWLGHENIQTTFDRYYWLIEEQQQAGGDAMRGLLSA